MPIGPSVYKKTRHLTHDRQVWYNYPSNRIYPPHSVASLQEWGLAFSQYSPVAAFYTLNVQNAYQIYLYHCLEDREKLATYPGLHLVEHSLYLLIQTDSCLNEWQCRYFHFTGKTAKRRRGAAMTNKTCHGEFEWNLTISKNPALVVNPIRIDKWNEFRWQSLKWGASAKCCTV